MATEADTPTINGIEIKEDREFVLTEDNKQLGSMVTTTNTDPEADDSPGKPAPLGAGTTLTVEEHNHYPDGLNVLFATGFGSVELNEIGIRNLLSDGDLKPVESTDQEQ